VDDGAARKRNKQERWVILDRDFSEIKMKEFAIRAAGTAQKAEASRNDPPSSK
jgi:hypothetical protein